MSIAQFTSRRQLRKQKGFSLVEFGLVMIVSGLMVTGALGVYTSYMKKAKLESSYKGLYETNEILAETWRIENRFYCPADPTLQPSDPQYGRENCAAIAAGTCTSGTNGVCAANGRDIGGGQTRVLIGMVPFKDISDALVSNQARLTRMLAQATDPAVREELRQTLNRSKKTMSLSAKNMAFDGWGHQYTYMVSQGWTVKMTEKDAATKASDEARLALRAGGSIIVQDDQGNVAAARGAQFAVISHGQNADGAYDVNGKRVGAACGTLSTIESENCDNDATIRRAPMNSAANNNQKTDDIIAYNANTSNEMWEKVACGTEMCLRNRNANRVAVGATTATEKLTVGGMMRSEDLKLAAAAPVCGKDGTNCISPNYIGGAAMVACPAGSGATKSVARQVGPGASTGALALKCQNFTLPSYNASCSNPDYIMVGFSGGQPDCRDPCSGSDGAVATQTRACPAGTSGSPNYEECQAIYSCSTRSYSQYDCTNRCQMNPVNGACGSSAGKNSVAAPTDNLCNSGDAGAVADTGSGWQWTCAGQHGGTSTTCTANKPVNGVCGSADKTIVASAPSGGQLCSAGSASAVNGSNPYDWTCTGGSEGTIAYCKTNPKTTVDPACGASNGGSYTSTPTDLCGPNNSASAVTTGAATYTWTCTGSGTPAPSPASKSCSANRVTTVNGACGTSDGGTYASAPSSNLCAGGTASGVTTGASTYTWSCAGGGTPVGTTASCSANKATTVNGACGSSDGGVYASAPSSNLCTTGTASGVTTGASTYTWSCAGGGTPAGTTASCSASKATTVNGACGSSNGNTYASAPTTNLCTAGSATSVTTGATTYTWSCNGTGTPTGSNASCSANKATTVNGACTAYGAYYASQPGTSTASGCTAGSYVDAADTGTQWKWTCAGTGTPAGTDSTCVANKATTVDGACASFGSYYGSQPATSTASGCTSGAYADISDTASQWKWTCTGTGTPAGSTATCVANKTTTTNGACGSTANTCNAGTASGYSAGSCGGSATWTCNGTGTPAGTNASCSVANGACPVNGACGGSAGTCSVGSVFNDNGSTACNTNRTWSCSGSNGGYAAVCSIDNAACPVCSQHVLACFVAGTKISLASGEAKNIEDIQKGDVVRSYDEKAGEFVDSKVVEPIHHAAKPDTLVEFTLSDDTTVTANKVHKIRVGKEYIAASEIVEKFVHGHPIAFLSEGREVTLKSVRVYQDSVNLYNLQVESKYDKPGDHSSYGHNYIANGIVVHNEKAESTLDDYEASMPNSSSNDCIASGGEVDRWDSYPRRIMCVCSGDPAAVNGVCGSSAATCTAGTVNNDNGSLTCGTNRTWDCAGLNGGSTVSCGMANAACSGGGGGGGGGCFTGTTKVIMADGSHKAIVNLKKGDKVRGHTQTNMVVSNKPFYVRALLYRINDSKDAYVTSNHPFYTKGGEWKAIDVELARKEHPGMEISQLKIGDILVHSDGSEIELKSMESEDHGWLIVYNPTLDGDHTYYANDLLMHNLLSETQAKN